MSKFAQNLIRGFKRNLKNPTLPTQYKKFQSVFLATFLISRLASSGKISDVKNPGPGTWY